MKTELIFMEGVPRPLNWREAMEELDSYRTPMQQRERPSTWVGFCLFALIFLVLTTFLIFGSLAAKEAFANDVPQTPKPTKPNWMELSTSQSAVDSLGGGGSNAGMEDRIADRVVVAAEMVRLQSLAEI